MRVLSSIAIFFSLWLAPSVHALERPPLPPTAKKLDAKGIANLYGSRRATYNNYTRDVPLTGEIFYDLAGKIMYGTYIWNKKDKGLFTGKIWAKGDKFCNKPDKGPQECVDVFLDGQTYYEVGDDGQVTSIDTIMDYPPKLPASAKLVSPEEFIAASSGKRVFATIFDLDKPVVAYLKWDWKKKRVTGDFVYGGTKKGKADTKLSIDGNTICGANKGEKAKNCYSYYLDRDGFYEMTADGKMHGWSSYE